MTPFGTPPSSPVEYLFILLPEETFDLLPDNVLPSCGGVVGTEGVEGEEGSRVLPKDGC